MSPNLYHTHHFERFENLYANTRFVLTTVNADPTTCPDIDYTFVATLVATGDWLAMDEADTLIFKLREPDLVKAIVTFAELKCMVETLYFAKFNMKHEKTEHNLLLQVALLLTDGPTVEEFLDLIKFIDKDAVIIYE